MAKLTTTMSVGTDFITVRIEVKGQCDHAEQAASTGIDKALHGVGHMMPMLRKLARQQRSNTGESVSTCKSTSDGTTCVVSVSGRVDGIEPLILNDLLGVIAHDTHKLVSKEASNCTPEDILIDLIKGLEDDLGEPDKIFGHSEGATPKSRDDFASAGFGPMANGHGPWG